MHYVVVYSGGLDSTVMLYHLRAQGHKLAALSVNYGQRHLKELEYAAALCQSLGVPYEVADISSVGKLLTGSSLTDSGVDVPDGHYAQESMKATVVPNRNMLLLSVAAAWGIAQKADAIAYAAHSGDHAIYPDCRPEFADAVSQAIALADWHKLEMARPFIGMNKAQIAILGAKLGVPFEKTWSCYKGQEKHCGRCGTCIERREALYLAGVDDPTEYADGAPSLQELVAKDWKLNP